MIRNATLGGVVADCATDTDVTGNTFTDWCSSDIVLSGSASGASEPSIADSANSDAPSELPTDIRGVQHADNPRLHYGG